jgi:uncharacterized protein with FMN-binding domain
LVLNTCGFLILAALLIACAQTVVTGGPIDQARLNDGTYGGRYRGGPNKASVMVTIQDGKIIKIEIVEHQAWKGGKAETPIVERIIVSQSTYVDAVSGATNSSRVIMNAVQNAIEKAYRN